MTPNNVVNIAGHRERKIARRAIEDALARIHAESRRALESQLVPRSFDAMADIVADGLPRQSMGEPGGSGGGHGDPTLGAVLANEHVVTTMRDAAGDVERALSYLVHALRLLDNVAAQTVPPAEAEAPGAGSCQSCDRFVLGTAKDRLRSGWCSACYARWRRAGCPDRSEFNAQPDDGDPGA